jgi:hypothetical protein
MRFCLVAVGLLGSSVLAQPSLGVHSGLVIPTGDFAQEYTVSPALGVDLLVPFWFGDLESSLEYVFLGAESEGRSAYMLPVLFGGRIGVGDYVCAGGGIALHVLRWEEGSLEEKSSEFGGYWNVCTRAPVLGRELEIGWKVHLLDFEDTALSFTVGTYF